MTTGTNRAGAPVHDSCRQAFARQNYAPQIADNNWQWQSRQEGRHAYQDDWRQAYQNNYRASGTSNCPVAAPYNAYPNNNQYRQGYYPQPYNAVPSNYSQAYNSMIPNYGAAMPRGLANMIQQRDNAQALYQQALRNGNRVRAKHLNHDIIAQNKNIAMTRNRDGFGPAYGSFDQPSGNSYGNGYGNSNLNSFAAPLLRNFMP